VTRMPSELLHFLPERDYVMLYAIANPSVRLCRGLSVTFVHPLSRLKFPAVFQLHSVPYTCKILRRSSQGNRWRASNVGHVNGYISECTTSRKSNP